MVLAAEHTFALNSYSEITGICEDNIYAHRIRVHAFAVYHGPLSYRKLLIACVVVAYRAFTMSCPSVASVMP